MKAVRAKLARFRVLAYRSCKDAELIPEQRLTVLIGPNGAGKTNLMQALLLLSLPAPRRRMIDPDDLYTSECQIEADFEVGKNLVRFRSSVTYSPNDMGRDDLVSAEEEWNFGGLSKGWIKGEELEVRLGRYLSDYNPTFTRRLYEASRRLASLRRAGKIRELPKNLQATYVAIQKLRYGMKYYSASQFTNPSQCPTSFDIDEDGDLRSDTVFTRRVPHTRFYLTYSI